jgi:hypothetical protein
LLRIAASSHAEFSNDSSECKLVLPRLTKLLATDFEKFAPKLTELGVMDRRLLEIRGTDIYENEAQRCAQAMMQTANNLSPFFVTSFCIHDKSDYEYSNGLLSQWRAYARGGFAIEFDEHEVDDLSLRERRAWSYAAINTDVVSYENYDVRIDPDRFKGMAGSFLRNLLRIDESPPQTINAFDQIVGTEEIGSFVQPFLSVAPFLKHYGFREEAEYRIVAICNRPTRITADDKRPPKEIRYKTRRGADAIPYIALYESFDKALPIRAIIIGPHAEQENQRHAVELLLEQYGIDAEIRVSETPFRE